MALHPTLPGAGHRQSARVLLLHGGQDVVALDLLHQLPEGEKRHIQKPRVARTGRPPVTYSQAHSPPWLLGPEAATPYFSNKRVFRAVFSVTRKPPDTCVTQQSHCTEIPQPAFSEMLRTTQGRKILISMIGEMFPSICIFQIF